jgi:hypothetical protein
MIDRGVIEGLPTQGDRAARRGSRKRYWAVMAIWGATIMIGLGGLLGYSLTPGQAAQSPSRWPARASLARSTDRPQLVMVAHPYCPCTRASIAELSWIMTKLNGQVAATVLFFEDDDTPDLERSEHWVRAAQIDGVRVVADAQGREANKFGAFTSGQVYLYDGQGWLLFSGGITPSRAHQGDNVGRRRIVDLVTEGTADRDQSAVYGCELRSPELASPWWSWLSFNG